MVIFPVNLSLFFLNPRKEAFIIPANSFALGTPPRSGDTIIGSVKLKLLMAYFASNGIEEILEMSQLK